VQLLVLVARAGATRLAVRRWQAQGVRHVAASAAEICLLACTAGAALFCFRDRSQATEVTARTESLTAAPRLQAAATAAVRWAAQTSRVSSDAQQWPRPPPAAATMTAAQLVRCGTLPRSCAAQRATCACHRHQRRSAMTFPCSARAERTQLRRRGRPARRSGSMHRFTRGMLASAGRTMASHSARSSRLPELVGEQESTWAVASPRKRLPRARTTRRRARAAHCTG
jgi:hypothetical protein